MDAADGSCVCSKSELDLFTRPPVNGDMERGSVQTHFPLATLAHGTPIEFHVAASPEEYVDLGRTMLHLELAMTKRGGGAMANRQAAVPCQLLLHTLFQQVDVKLNDRLVTPSLNTYPYKAYLETLLSHGDASKGSWLSAEGWFGEANEAPELSNPGDGAAGEGLLKRASMVQQSRPFQLRGRPHVDIFQQDRYLVPGVDMHVKFLPSDAAFHLLYDPEKDTQGHFKINIRRAELLVRRVRLNPSVALAHAQQLESGKTVKYPLRRGVVTTFAVPLGSQSFVKENLISGQLPRRAFVAMTTNAAFNGTPPLNPFNFQHFGLNFLTASIASESFPSQPYKPDFANGRYVEVFTDLMRAAGFQDSGRGCSIDYAAFVDGGNVIAGFDFTADMAEGAHVDPIKYGSLRLEGHFGAALTAAVNVIVYAEYDNLIQVDRSRNVTADFSST